MKAWEDLRIRRGRVGVLVGRRVYETPDAGVTREAALLTAKAVIMQIIEIPQCSKKRYWRPATLGELSSSRPASGLMNISG